MSTLTTEYGIHQLKSRNLGFNYCDIVVDKVGYSRGSNIMCLLDSSSKINWMILN